MVRVMIRASGAAEETALARCPRFLSRDNPCPPGQAGNSSPFRGLLSVPNVPDECGWNNGGGSPRSFRRLSLGSRTYGDRFLSQGTETTSTSLTPMALVAQLTSTPQITGARCPPAFHCLRPLLPEDPQPGRHHIRRLGMRRSPRFGRVPCCPRCTRILRSALRAPTNLCQEGTEHETR